MNQPRMKLYAAWEASHIVWIIASYTFPFKHLTWRQQAHGKKWKKMLVFVLFAFCLLWWQTATVWSLFIYSLKGVEWWWKEFDRFRKCHVTTKTNLNWRNDSIQQYWHFFGKHCSIALIRIYSAKTTIQCWRLVYGQGECSAWYEKCTIGWR